MGFADIKNDFSGMLKYKRHKALGIILVVLCSLLLSVIAQPAYAVLSGSGLIETGTIGAYIADFSLMNVYRAGIVFFASFFLLIHFIVDISVFYNAIFKYRYVLAVLLFLILVINQIHFSSVGMYHNYIQPDIRAEFGDPIFGTPRPIRSDEWAVTTPLQLSAQYDPEPYGQFNFIARGTATENMPFGMAMGFATMAFPLSVFYLLGVEYGVSARWVGLLIMTFMVTFEFMHVISRKNRLLAVAGACLITFSPLFQWWSYIIFIPAGIGALVCFYYFLNSDTKIKKLMFSFGIAVFLSMFIVNLYPAWQVPAGYLYLALAIWIASDNWGRVKRLGKIDYGFLAAAVVLIAAVVMTYLFASGEYMAGISATVYPGARIFTGGEEFGSFINRMVNGGVFAPISAISTFANTNVCEFGGIYTLFPVPILFLSYMMIRKKVFDLFSTILIAYTVFIGSYIYLGWPEWLAQITLMSYSASSRALDVLLFSQVFLFIRAMSLFAPQKETRSGKSGFISVKAAVGAAAISVCLTFIAVSFFRTTFINPIGLRHLIYFSVIFLGFAVVTYSLLDAKRDRRVFRVACLYLICMSCATWLTIHPIMKGLDAIYSKPLSVKITELAVYTNEKWISTDHVFYGPSFLIASGASTINSTGVYPNLELWHKLDPERKYEEIYNRYAHITVALTAGETSFELWGADHFLLNLSYNDLAVAGVKYIHTAEPLDDNGNVRLTLLYSEGGSMIYSVS